MPTFGGLQATKDPLFSDVQFEPKKADTAPAAAPKMQISAGSAGEADDVQARYEQLVKSGATAISSDMLFGREEQQAREPNSQGGRWS